MELAQQPKSFNESSEKGEEGVSELCGYFAQYDIEFQKAPLDLDIDEQIDGFFIENDVVSDAYQIKKDERSLKTNNFYFQISKMIGLNDESVLWIKKNFQGKNELEFNCLKTHFNRKLSKRNRKFQFSNATWLVIVQSASSVFIMKMSDIKANWQELYDNALPNYKTKTNIKWVTQKGEKEATPGFAVPISKVKQIIPSIKKLT